MPTRSRGTRKEDRSANLQLNCTQRKGNRNMNNPKHVKKVKREAIKIRKTHRTWLASETALQETIAEFIKAMKRVRA